MRSKILSILAVVALALPLAACRVRQTQEGELPKVDVDVKAEEGQMPKYDVDAPDVDVTTKDATVKVPTDVDVKTEDRTVKVPDVDVKMPPPEPTPPQ
jgi:hypothetical protein